jgi:hypothetical protein
MAFTSDFECIAMGTFRARVDHKNSNLTLFITLCSPLLYDCGNGRSCWHSNVWPPRMPTGAQNLPLFPFNVKTSTFYLYTMYLIVPITYTALLISNHSVQRASISY